MTIFIIALEADSLDLKLGDEIYGGRVIKLEAELEPEKVSASWLAQRYDFSPQHIRNALSDIKQGGSGKYVYPRLQAIQLLTQKPKRRGAPKKN